MSFFFLIQRGFCSTGEFSPTPSFFSFFFKQIDQTWQGLTVWFTFCRWHTKSPYSSTCSKISFSYVFVNLFIYFFILLTFFFLLNTAAWDPPCRKPQYGSVGKSESKATRKKKKQGEPPGEIKLTMAPSGHHLGTGEIFPLPSPFPFSCMVSRLESSTLTLLLTQPLRDGCNSSLSMAPVIEPSERERRSVRETEREGEGESEVQGREESVKAGEEWNSIVISGLLLFWVLLILLLYCWADAPERSSVLKLIHSLIIQTSQS